MNKSIKKIVEVTVFGALFSLSFTQSAVAIPVNIVDGYIGGNDHHRGDVIGHHSTFNISSMDVDIVGNTLSVSINTGFAGKGDNHLFDGYTNNKGIGYGDLFLSSSWNPYGGSAYINDNNSNGTTWEYAFSLDDRWMHESLPGTGTLYKLNSGNNNADALLSDDYLTGATYRNGQEVAVDKVNGDVTAIAGNSSWNITPGKVNFSIDLTGTLLAGSDTIAMHWGMTCANDTIEGKLVRNVPEPGTFTLLMAGFAGMGFLRRKTKKID